MFVVFYSNYVPTEMRETSPPVSSLSTDGITAEQQALSQDQPKPSEAPNILKTTCSEEKVQNNPNIDCEVVRNMAACDSESNWRITEIYNLTFGFVRKSHILTNFVVKNYHLHFNERERRTVCKVQVRGNRHLSSTVLQYNQFRYW